jgi:hypothetical protein
MEENQELHLEGTEGTEGTEIEAPKNTRPISTRKQLKESLAQIDSLLKYKSMKSAKLADLAIERAGLVKLLLQNEHDDKHNAAIEENERLTAEVTSLGEENARLTQANAELRASQPPRVNAQVLSERIPDSALQQITTLEELLKSVATLARGVDVDARTRHAVSLVIKHGKRAMSVVEGLGVDFSACASSLQKPESELLGLLSAAQQEGTGTPIWRAVLAVKYEIQVDGHGKRQHPDVFAESNLYADTL